MSELPFKKQPDDVEAVVSRDATADLTAKQLRLILPQIRALANSTGWLYIQSVLKSQAEQRFGMVARTVPQQMEDIFLQSFQRGEANALEILICLPDFLIAQMDKQLEQFAANDEDINDDLDD